MELGMAGVGWGGATGGRARRPARRSAKRCFWRRAISRSGCWTPQLALARSWRTRDRTGASHELCTAPAVPPALAPAKRRSAAPWLRCSVWGGERGCCSPRRRSAPRRDVLGLYARHWLSLARRSGVGARSEEDVQRALARLQVEGWRVRHSLRWQGRGDIDSVAIAPTGIAVAIETKTRTYDRSHLARVGEQAAWLSRRRRRWARNGALGVLCLVRARGVERVENEVPVVSIDRLTHVLRVAAGMRPEARSNR